MKLLTTRRKVKMFHPQKMDDLQGLSVAKINSSPSNKKKSMTKKLAMIMERKIKITLKLTMMKTEPQSRKADKQKANMTKKMSVKMKRTAKKRSTVKTMLVNTENFNHKQIKY